MIKNFETQTQPLTEYEQGVLLPVMLVGLRTKSGKMSAVTNRTIVVRLNALGYKINDSRVRKIVNHIRTNDLIPGLIASSDGYYIAETADELLEYEESLLGRENAIKEVRLAMNRQRKILFGEYPITNSII